ncbi:MAG: hypothetical protein SFV15_00760 [Polyangiaceae bacterium]|nr:hypothetical protein [Polyangiaceae bacterium]
MPGSSESDLGTAELRLGNTPPDVLCVQLQAKGANRTARQSLDITQGQSGTFMLNRLPTGKVEFSASAYPSSCSSVQANSVPTWIAEPVTVTVQVNPPAGVNLVLLQNGRSQVGVSFGDPGTSLIADICPPDSRLCDGVCTSTASPITGCGTGPCTPCSLRVLHVESTTCSSPSSGGAPRCDFTACETGYADLDGNRDNGCETRTPVGIGGKNLRLWFDGDTLPSGLVSKWADSASSSLATLTGAGTTCSADENGAPLGCTSGLAPVRADNFNGSGRPWLLQQFSTGADFMATHGPNFLVGSAYTAIGVVGRTRIPEPGLHFVLGSIPGPSEPSNGFLLVGFRDPLTFTAAQGANDLDLPVPPPPGGEGIQVLAFATRLDLSSGRLLKVWGPGLPEISATSASTAPITGPYLPGWGIGGPGYFNPASDWLPLEAGGIAEILVFDRALTDTEITQVQSYLALKWKL